MNRRGKARHARRRRDRWSPGLAAFCIPFNLFLIWSRECPWPKRLKAAATLGIAVPVTIAAALMISPPRTIESGVILNGAKPVVVVFGPEAPEDLPEFEIYDPLPTSIAPVLQTSPPAIYVYYNEGGKNYHAMACRYFKHGKSHRVTLSDALYAGLTRCAVCEAPPEDAG